jgi:hypothetical protein
MVTIGKISSVVVFGVTIASIKRVVWDQQPTRHTPQTVLNTVNPVGWHRPHKWIIGEIHVLGEAHVAIAACHSFTADNATGTITVTGVDENGANHIATYSNAIVDGVTESIIDGDDLITIIRFSSPAVVLS